MSTILVDDLWAKVCRILTLFSDRLRTSDPTLIGDVGRTSNATFLLRGYLSISRRVDGDEIAVTVDVQSDRAGLIIASDICTDQGKVVATGPSASLDGIQASIDDALNRWLRDFEQFLQGNEQVVGKLASRLK